MPPTSPTGQSVGTPESNSHGGRSRAFRAWAAAAVVLVALGVMGSIGGARSIASSTSQRDRRAFVATSQGIASSLRVSIQHIQDLIESTNSFLIGDPNATKVQFDQWAQRVAVLRRHSEVISVGIIDYVPRTQLASFEATQARRQGTPFTLAPSGSRPYYCFATVGVERTVTPIIPQDFDVCDNPTGSEITDVRTSGKSAVLPYTYNGQKVFGLETPEYSGGAVPATVAARDAQFVDVIGVLLVPHTFLASALVGHPDVAVALHFGGASSSVVYISGARRAGGLTAEVSLHDGWTLQTIGPPLGQGLFHSEGALLLLFGGIVLSLLLGALIFTLGTGRARSMLLVRDRTAQLQHQALHDTLTGLPNRALIVDRITQLLERNRRNGTAGAALFVDLDDFKSVNDSLGHEAGDHLLELVAWRMKNALRGADTIGRMGGDEFVVLIDGDAPHVAASVVAQRLLDLMHQPFVLKGALMPIYVNISIGVAVGDRRSASDLLRDADVALYEAKGAGKNQFAFFDSTMASESGRRISLEFDLRSALDDEEFHLVYQPIYRASDLSIVAVEALLRWRHPTEGVIQPDEFIPILESTGKIREVGAWVLRQVCTQSATWRAQGYAIDVTVNVSARQFDSDLIIEQIRDAMHHCGGQDSLLIEVTETALMRDVDATIRRLRSIQGLGVRIAIDDFGTGYCSLSYLQQFPIDYIKIDQSFIGTLATSAESTALVKTFINLSRDLGFKTIAEGVETVEQLDILRAIGVTEVQGFLFARPLYPSELERRILEPIRLALSPTPTSAVWRPPLRG